MFRPRLLSFVLVALTCLAMLAPVATHAQDRTEAPGSTGSDQTEQEGTEPEQGETPPEENEVPVDTDQEQTDPETEEEESDPEIHLQAPWLSVNGAGSSLDVTDATSLVASASSLNDGASYSLTISNGYGCGGGQQVGLGSGSGQLSADLGAFAAGTHSVQAVDTTNTLSSNCVNITVQPTLVVEPTDEPAPTEIPTEEPAPTDEPLPTDIPATEIPAGETPPATETPAPTDIPTEEPPAPAGTPTPTQTGERPAQPDASPTAEVESEFEAAAVTSFEFYRSSETAEPGATLSVFLELSLEGPTTGGTLNMVAPPYTTITDVVEVSQGSATCSLAHGPDAFSSTFSSGSGTGVCSYGITLRIDGFAPAGFASSMTASARTANPVADFEANATIHIQPVPVNFLTISANPPHPAPGDIVTITVQHSDPATGPISGLLDGSLPEGTEFSSATASCVPVCATLDQPQQGATAVSVLYDPEEDTPTVVTLTYQVRILPGTEGSFLSFTGSGVDTRAHPTGPAQISISVAISVAPLTITAVPANPAPGDIVTVTVQHIDPVHIYDAGSLLGSIPAGTELDASSTPAMTCDPADCSSMTPAVSATSIRWLYRAAPETPTTVTLTYQVRVLPGTEGSTITFVGNGSVGAGQPTGPASASVTVAGTPLEPSLTITANPPIPQPGDIVTVTVQHLDPATTSRAGSLLGNIPAGTEFSGASATCNPDCGALDSLVETATSIRLSYFPEEDSPTTVTLTYRVKILPGTAPGTTITFEANGTINSDVPTGSASAIVTVVATPVAPITITANPPNPQPGDIVTVTVQHQDPALTQFGNWLQGSIPAGTEFVTDSSVVTCTGACTVQALPPPSSGTVTVSYVPELDTPTTVTLTYQVTILPETTPGTTITFVGNGSIGLGQETGPAETSVVVAGSPDTSLTISVNSPNAQPGDIVTVTVQHIDPATIEFAGSLQGSLPAGTEVVPSSPTVTCNPACIGHSATVSATSVNAGYLPVLFSETTVTLTYQVTILPGTEGSTIVFTGSGVETIGAPTGPAEASVVVAGSQLVAQDQSLTVPFEGTGTGTLTATGGVSPLSFAAGPDAPDKGEVVVNPDGTFTYTANPGQTGTDSFTFTVTDSQATPQSATGTVTVTIGEPDALVATTLTLETNADASVSGNLAGQISGGIPPYTFALATPPAQGTVTLNPDGTFTYVPDSDASGTDSFTYTVTDSAPVPQVNAVASTTGTVNIVFTAATTPTPTPGPTETPIPGETPSPAPTNPGTGVPGDPDDDEESPTEAPGGDNDGGSVPKLPNTGTGSSGSGDSSTIPALLTFFFLIAALALIASAVRKGHRRSC